jgi:hypothetical protein
MFVNRYPVAIVTLLITLGGCSTSGQPQNQPAQGPDTNDKFEFTDCGALIADIAQSLDDESRTLVKSTAYDDLIQFHFSWGMGIRNSTGLWSGNDALNRSCAQLRGGSEKIHPDDVSMIVIQEVWKILQVESDA